MYHNADPKPIKQEKQPPAKKPRKLNKRLCINKSCRKRFQKERHDQSACCITCAIEHSKYLKEKRERAEWRERKKELKEKQKKLSDWKNDLQDKINWIVRTIDKNQPCISHPDLKDFLRYDAGHAWTVKNHSDIRFNLHNIHKQSSEANQRHGYCAEYQRGLRERYGPKYLEMVEGLPLKYKGTAKEKFTIPNIRNEYLPRARQVKRMMEKGEEFTRDQVNELIGIYK